MRLPAWVERILNPCGTCLRCRRPWKLRGIGVEPHITHYSSEYGCFPLCEGCWAALTPTERLPYYARLHASWPFARHAEDWPRIRAAVEAGL